MRVIRSRRGTRVNLQAQNVAAAHPEVVGRMTAIIRDASTPDPNYSFKPKPKNRGKARRKKP